MVRHSRPATVSLTLGFFLCIVLVINNLNKGLFSRTVHEPWPCELIHGPGYCRILTQTAKTRGGILEVPAYRQDYFAVAEKISIFQQQGSQGIAEKYAKDCRNFAGDRINTRRNPGAEFWKGKVGAVFKLICWEIIMKPRLKIAENRSNYRIQGHSGPAYANWLESFVEQGR